MRIPVAVLGCVLVLGGCSGEEPSVSPGPPEAPTSIPPVDAPTFSTPAPAPTLEPGFPIGRSLLLAPETASGYRIPAEVSSTYGWWATTKPEVGTAASCADDSAGLLRDGGYRQLDRVDMDGGHLVRFDGDRFEIDVTSNDRAGGGCMVTYQVRPHLR